MMIGPVTKTYAVKINDILYGRLYPTWDDAVKGVGEAVSQFILRGNAMGEDYGLLQYGVVEVLVSENIPGPDVGPQDHEEPSWPPLEEEVAEGLSPKLFEAWEGSSNHFFLEEKQETPEGGTDTEAEKDRKRWFSNRSREW